MWEGMQYREAGSCQLNQPKPVSQHRAKISRQPTSSETWRALQEHEDGPDTPQLSPSKTGDPAFRCVCPLLQDLLRELTGLASGACFPVTLMKSQSSWHPQSFKQTFKYTILANSAGMYLTYVKRKIQGEVENFTLSLQEGWAQGCVFAHTSWGP